MFQALKAGTKFVDGKLAHDNEKEEDEKEIPDDERTMLVVRDIANSIDPMIQMTVDFPSNHEDKKVPMLDVKVWMKENNELYYQFYEKPTKNRFVISKDSAMPMSKKIDSLSQGVFRRLHNTKDEIEWEVKVIILEKYMAELKASGYSEYDRYEVLKSGIGRYESLRRKEKEGKRPFFRHKNFESSVRKEEKERKKNNWFRKNNNKFTSVFFVPPTPGSTLLKMLKQTEQKFQIGEENRIKFVETCGQKYIDYFRSSNPFNIKCKPEEKCLLCDSSLESSNCKVSNIGYTLICKLCKDRNIKKHYHGESARNAYLRGREHVSEYGKKSKNSVMYKHVISDHKNEQDDVKFEMNIVGRFNSAINRQINESIRIRNEHSSVLLNSKSEFYGPCIKRKVLEN